MKLIDLPVVSVVIPTLNRPRQLAHCLEALRQQTLQEPWEVIVVDDGSIVPVAETESRQSLTRSCALQIIRQPNKGPAAARNRGATAAKAQLIAFTDDDCMPDITWLERLLLTWQDNTLAMVGGLTINSLDTNIFASASQLILDLVYDFYNRNPYDSLFFASNNFLCSKQQFLFLSGFDESFPRAGAEDRDFCNRWRQMKFPLIFSSSACVYHHHHQSLASYIGLHVRYGRGAYLYQLRKRQRLSGTLDDDLKFHKSLPALLRSRWRTFCAPRWKIAILSLLVVWQIANLVGFMYEFILHRLN